MKQELTFAVVLLAIGGFALYSNFGPSNQSSDQAIANVSEQSQQLATAESLPPKDFESIAQASFQDAGTYAPANDSKENDEPNSTNSPDQAPQISNSNLGQLAVSQAIFDIKQTDPTAVRLLAESAKQIANSKPFRSTLELRAKTFGQDVFATGNYYQMGQGTHKTRIEMVFESFASQPTLTQICDGRFFYTIHGENVASGDLKKSPRRSLEFVDLERVQQAAGERPNKLSPTGWVATGGLSSLLQHLASGFNFSPPTQLENSMVMVRGVWDPNALRLIISDPDSPTTEEDIQWDQVPEQLPHAVEFIFSSSNGGFFPRQVSFLRFDSKGAAVPTMALNFSSPKPLNNLADGFFVINSDNLEPNDTTDRYIARIESFQQTQQAAVESSTVDR